MKKDFWVVLTLTIVVSIEIGLSSYFAGVYEGHGFALFFITIVVIIGSSIAIGIQGGWFDW